MTAGAGARVEPGPSLARPAKGETMNLPKASSVAATVLTCAGFLASPTLAATGDPVATQEMGLKNEWVRQHFVAAPGQGQGFFSLIYGGRPAAALFPSWNRQTRENKIDDQRTEHLLSPLTPYSLSEHDWIAWQFDRPSTGGGMVQVFRRTRSDEVSRRLKLVGLDPEAVYELRDLDRESLMRATGRVLMGEGLLAVLPHRPQALLIKYRRLEGTAAVISASAAACDVGQRITLTGNDSRSPGAAVASYH